MNSLLNPGGNTAQEKEVPANPFKLFIRWQSTAGKWIVKEGGLTKELTKPLQAVVLDYFNTIQGGSIGVTDVWSKPYYRRTSDIVAVWAKEIASGRIAKVAEGKVEDIYDKLKSDFNASKGVKAYVFLPQTGQIALLDLSGYAISPFYDAESSEKKPGITLELEPQEVTPRPAYGTRYAPLISSMEVDEKTIAAAIDAFVQSGAIEYLNYMEGKEAEAPTPEAEAEAAPIQEGKEAEAPTPEAEAEAAPIQQGEKKAEAPKEESKKTSDPWE